MKLHYKKLFINKLAALGYSYNVQEGGYVSKDRKTIIINNRDPYIGEITALSPHGQEHYKNLYKLLQYGAVTLEMKEGQNESETAPGRDCCCCGGSEFTAHQICRHDIVVNSDNVYFSDAGVYDAETPYGPYTCKRCGAEYDDLDDLWYVMPADRKTLCFNGELSIGDIVLSTDGDDYSYLVGVVRAINHLGTAEHETENEEDEVFVDFTVFDYSESRIKEIEAMFTDLYQQPKVFEELPIDEPIMQPSSLVRITGISEDMLSGILDGEAKAAEYCSKVEPVKTLPEELVMVLCMVQLENGLNQKQISALMGMLPSEESFMPIEFHQNNSSAYGFIRDTYYEEHNYNAEDFHGLVLPVLEGIREKEYGYYTTPDNRRVYIGYF